MSSLMALAEQIENSGIGMAIAESRYVFILLEGIHLIGLAVAAGLIVLTDLRLIGVILKGVPLAQVVLGLRPYVLTGFAVIFASGGLLFWSAAARMLDSPAFVIKMFLIVLAGLNALYFELVIARRRGPLRAGDATPRSYRYAGIASLTLWTLVIMSGRLIPYLPSWSGYTGLYVNP